MSSASQEQIREAVREGYGKIAQSGGASSGCGCGAGGCCGGNEWSSTALAERIGYDAGELAGVPESANMGLSCGNPTAIASLKPGEIVLDLGSGGGFDAFIAGPKVGPNGRVIGVDMTAEMIAKARRNIDFYRTHSGLNNVEFRLGEIEHLPVADNSVDVVISNCVLNLSPDKPQVWREIARVLKPGGRVAISDLMLLQPLPESVAQMIEALVGCVAGAVLIDQSRSMARDAGLIDVNIECKSQYIDALENWKDPLYVKILESLPKGAKPSDYITSADVSARKPLK